MNDSHRPLCEQVFVAIASHQISALVIFYQTLLGAEPTVEGPLYAEFNAQGLRLGIFQPQSDNAAEFLSERPGRVSLCVEVEDISRAIAQVEALTPTKPGELMQTSHGREVYLYDPDGNRVILHCSV